MFGTKEQVVLNLPFPAKVALLGGLFLAFILGEYEKIYNTAQKRSVRRFIKQLFSSFIKRRSFDCKAEIKNIIEMLRGIEVSLDIIAREIARQAKRGE